VSKAHATMAPLSDSHRCDEPVLPLRNKSRYMLGIIEEFDNNHLPYIAACEDLGVRYKTLDISGPDWIQIVRGCGCDAFLVWPSFKVSIWKRMFDERLTTFRILRHGCSIRTNKHLSLQKMPTCRL
jgi:hypothetical protein